MKKILIATTALTLTAGVAVAEVTVSGDARMGLVYNDNGADSNTNFTSRVRASFTMSGETDGGLSFGGSFGVHNEGGSNGSISRVVDPITGVVSFPEGGRYASNGGRGSVFLSGAFGKISMGDVAGAAEAAVGDLSGVGLTGLGDYNEGIYYTGDGVEVGKNNPILQYSYSTGGLSLYLSANDGKLNSSSIDDTNNFAIGAAYAFGDYTVGIGYEDADANGSQIILGGSAKFGAATVKAVYGTNDDLDVDQYGISVDGSFGAATVTGYAKVVETAGASATAIGLGGVYDLGGGASVKGGVSNLDVDGAADSVMKADIGVSFSF